MTIKQLLKMPVGDKIGGGFTLTVKMTKKAVLLPNGRYIHTAILFDDTGEMVADFKDPGGKGAYNPLIKGYQYKIIVAEIQSADPTSNKIALKDAKKLFVDQYAVVTSQDFEPGEEYPDWRTTVRGKIRHGLTCSYIKSGKEPDKDTVNKWTEFIMTGE